MTSRSTSFTTTHRVINRVHSNRSCTWSNTSPATTTCLTNTFVHVVCIGCSTYCGHTYLHHIAHLTRRHLQGCHSVFSRKQLHKAASASRDSSTLTWLHLHIMNDSTKR